MVTVAVLLVPSVAPTGLLSVSVKVSLVSLTLSPITVTLIVCDVTPAAKVSVLNEIAW